VLRKELVQDLQATSARNQQTTNLQTSSLTYP
jgi:hypothetical protein